MNQGPDLEQSLQMIPRMGLEMSPQQVWYMSPFQEVEGADVMKKMRLGSADLEETYKSMRDHLYRHNVLFVGATARNKWGKGGLLQGIRRTFRQDLYLRERLQAAGIQLEWRTFPFAHFDRAAKLPKDKYPELGLVDPDKTPDTNTADDEETISALQWTLLQRTLPDGVTTDEELSEYLKQQGKAVIWAVEGSTTFVLPRTYKPPVQVEGEHDLGVSTICNVALDRRTRKHAYLFGIDADPKLKDDEGSNEFREQAFTQNFDPKSLYGHSNKVVIEIGGIEVDVEKLPLKVQRAVQLLLNISMAPVEAIAIQHGRKDELNRRLFEEGIITEPTDRGFYGELNARLHLPTGRFLVPENNWFLGVKDYDIGYLLDSEPLRRYPEILPGGRDSYKILTSH